MTAAPQASYRAWQERCLWAAAFTAMLASALLVARNALQPEQQPVSFGQFFWLGFTLLYGAAAFVFGVLGWIATRCRAVAREALYWLAAGGILVLAFSSNIRALRRLAHLDGPWRHQVFLPASVAVAVAGLLVLGLVRRRRWPGRLLGALGIVAMSIALWPSRTPPPALSSLTDWPLVTGTPLAVIGIDGADWRYIEPLIARGEMPHLGALRDRGIWGPLASMKPALPPRVWTTIGTGALPMHHGLTGFTRRRLAGIEDTLPPLLPVRRMGYHWMARLLRDTGLEYESPTISTDRRVPAYWNVATLARSPVATVGWWATWPAEPVLGYLVSDRLYWTNLDCEALSYPPALSAEIRPMVRTNTPLADGDALRFLKEADRHGKPGDDRARYRRTIRQAYLDAKAKRKLAILLIERGRREYGGVVDLLTMFRGVDGASRAALQYSELVSDHLNATPTDLERFGGFLTATYREMDHSLGEILAAMGDVNVVVVSDHGFGIEKVGNVLVYRQRTTAPDGIIVAAGPAFGRGRIEGLSVHDVFPILLRARGLPMTRVDSRRLDRRVFEEGFLDSHPVRVVDKYGPWRVRQQARASRKGDAEIMHQLRELGYLD